MSEQPPIFDSQPLSDEHKRLIALFDELEKTQIDFLDGAGKRVIELTTALLGILFAIAAFGDKFPPPYLAGNTRAKVLTLATLLFLLAALLLAAWAIRPRRYQRYHNNLTALRQELDSIIAYKMRWSYWAGGLFVLGLLSLAALIATLIWPV